MTTAHANSAFEAARAQAQKALRLTLAERFAKACNVRPSKQCQRERLFTALQPLVALSPLAQQMVDWARAQNVPVALVPSLSHGGLGFYEPEHMPDRGQIFISLAVFKQSPDIMLQVLMHEIRHAWQNSVGLFSGTWQGFMAPVTWKYMYTALIEADAYAHEKAIVAQLQGDRRSAVEILQEHFHAWYREQAGVYLKIAVESEKEYFFMHEDDADLTLQEWRTVLRGLRDDDMPHGDLIDIFSRAYHTRLGRMMDGGNYMTRDLQAQVSKNYLSPMRARLAFGMAGADMRGDMLAFEKQRQRFLSAISGQRMPVFAERVVVVPAAA